MDLFKRCSNPHCSNPARNADGLLPATEEYFYRHRDCKYGLRPNCKLCKLERDRQYVESNKTHVLAQCRTYRENHKEQVSRCKKDWYQRHADQVKQRTRQYAQKNRESVTAQKKEYSKNRLKNDPEYRIVFNLRRRMRHALKNQRKSARTLELIGCTPKELREYLERQFTDKMTWDNYGTVWHIDHIVPCVAFCLEYAEEQRRCFHYTNLQPLLAKDNLVKGAKIQ